MKQYHQELILKMYERKCFFIENLSKIRYIDDVIAEQVTSSKKLLCEHIPFTVGFHCGKFDHYSYTQSNVMHGGANRPQKKLRTIKKAQFD